MKNLLLSVILFFTFQFNLKAAKVYGGSMRHESLGNGKFLITAKIYRDCRSLSMPSSQVSFGVYAGTNGGNACGSYALTGFSRVAINEVTSRCSTTLAQCSPANTGASGDGIEEHVYQATVDFNASPLKNFTGASCCQVTFYAYVSTSLYYNSISNDMYLTSMLDICNIAKTPERNRQNTSPLFSNPHQFFVCCNQTHTEAPGAIDTMDFDSMKYRLVYPIASLPKTQGTLASPFTMRYFITPYCIPLGNVSCAPNRLTKPARGIYFDTGRGDIEFTPTSCGERAVRVLEVLEYRKDSSGKWLHIGTNMNIVGHTVKDDCGYNKAPAIEGPFANKVCAGDKICFNIYGKDETFTPFQSVPDTVMLTWDGAIPGATFTVTNPKDREKTGEFCWQTKPEHARDHAWVFTVSAKDQHCNRPAVSSVSFSVLVKKPIKADTAIVKIIPCRNLVLYSKANTYKGLNQSVSWQVKDSAGKILVQTGKAIDTIPLQYSGRLFAFRTISNGTCTKTYVDTVMISSLPSLYIGRDTQVCIGQKLQVKANGTGLNAPVKYKWTFKGNSSFSDTGSQISFSVVRDTVLSLAVTEGSGCILRDTLEVKMLGKSTSIFTRPIPALCANYGLLPLKTYVTTYGSNGNDSFWSGNFSTAVIHSGEWSLNTRNVDSKLLTPGNSVSVHISASYTDISGCSFTDSVVAKITGNPVVALTEEKSICQSGGDYVLRNLILVPKNSFGLDCSWKCIEGPAAVDLNNAIDKTGSVNAYDDKLVSGSINENFRTGLYRCEYKVIDKISGCEGRDTVKLLLLPNTKIEALPVRAFCSNDARINLNQFIRIESQPPGKNDAGYKVFEFNYDASHFNTGVKKLLNDTMLNAQNTPGVWGIRTYSSVNGCKDSADFYITVNANPDAGFTTNPVTQTTMDNPVFKTTNTTLPGQSSLKSWLWYMPGAIKERSIVWEPEIVYDSAGIYDIYLYTEDLNGCRDTAQTSVTVNKLNLSVNKDIAASGLMLNHLLQIANADFANELKLYNATGKLVFCSNGNKGIIDFDGVPGVYLYTIRYSGNGKSGIIRGKVNVLSSN